MIKLNLDKKLNNFWRGKFRKTKWTRNELADVYGISSQWNTWAFPALTQVVSTDNPNHEDDQDLYLNEITSMGATFSEEWGYALDSFDAEDEEGLILNINRAEGTYNRMRDYIKANEQNEWCTKTRNHQVRTGA